MFYIKCQKQLRHLRNSIYYSDHTSPSYNSNIPLTNQQALEYQLFHKKPEILAKVN